MASKITVTAERKAKLLEVLGSEEKTANEIIGEIFKTDLLMGGAEKVLNKGWQHYLHLNKLLAPMEREGLIKTVGTKKEGRKPEKVWKRVYN